MKPDFVFVIAIIGSVVCHVVFPLQKVIHFPLWLLGILISIAGYVLSSRANVTLIQHQTSIQPHQNPKVFVTSGPFGFSRNPVYLGMALILFGIAWSLGSLTPFVFPVLFVVLINRFVIPDEELDLEKMFGRPYHEYRKKVRRWI